MVEFTLKGRMVSGKNQVIVTRNGGHFPNPRFKAWREVMTRQLSIQKTRMLVGQLFPMGPVKITIDYYPGDRIRRDATGIMDAIWHLAGPKHGNLVADDSQFKIVRWTEHNLDRLNPRLIMRLESATLED